MNVLIVDDSAVYRAKIRSALAGVPWLNIVGSASNGQVALDLLDQHKVDLMTLDMEMPIMGGLETLRKLKERGSRTKVIVLSSSTRSGSESTMEALASGANDFMAKPTGEAGTVDPEQLIRTDLLPKIRQFLRLDTVPHVPSTAKRNESWRPKDLQTFIPSVVVIASSTGGPSAHDLIFRGLKGVLRCPVLIAQHMPPVFTTALANRISNYNGLPCREGVHGEPLQNRIYVAPGDYHMTVANIQGQASIQLDQGPTRGSVRPAADNLFESVAQVFGAKCMGVVLTGMGEDGLAGSKAIKTNGGGIMIQSQESCVVFGMPGAVSAAGCFDGVGSPEEIYKLLARMVLK